jgi:HEAT repeat protein
LSSAFRGASALAPPASPFGARIGNASWVARTRRHSRTRSLRVTEVCFLGGGEAGYTALLPARHSRLSRLRSHLRGRPDWEVEPFMTRQMLAALLHSLGASGRIEARWEGDEAILAETSTGRRYQQRLAPDRKRLYAVGAFRRIGAQDWTWIEVTPPWPGPDTSAREIIALLTAPVPNTWPIANRIKARARIEALAGALDLAPEPALRERICYLISRRGAADCVVAVPALLPLLEAPEPGVRAEAADALGQIATTTSAAAVLSYAGDAGARVLAALTAERDDRARALLAAAAGALRHTPALPHLVLLLGDGDWLVRRESAWSIGVLGAPAATRALDHALAREPDAHAAEAMRAALVRIAGHVSDRSRRAAHEQRA